MTLFFEAEGECFLLTGKRFKLARATLGVGIVGAKRTAVTVPAGDIVEVTSGPRSARDNETVDALWDGQPVILFAIDINVRGTEVTDRRATKKASE